MTNGRNGFIHITDYAQKVIVDITFTVKNTFNNILDGGNGSAGVDWWKPTTNNGEVNNTRIITISDRIIGSIQVVGSVTSVIALIVIGIKYVIASAEEKAKYKETSKAYIIGAVLVFATSNIAKFLFDFAVGTFG